MPHVAATDARHPDPALQPRVYRARLEDAVEVVATLLEEERGWTVGVPAGASPGASPGEGEDPGRTGGGGGVGRVEATRSGGLMRPQEDLQVEVTLEREGACRLEARLEMAGVLAFRWRARRRLKSLLWGIDARLARAQDTPMRQVGYR